MICICTIVEYFTFFIADTFSALYIVAYQPLSMLICLYLLVLSRAQ